MIESEQHAEMLSEPPALAGRWTICAMLFVATSINYMDRQVLSILKPVLEGSTLHLQPFFHGWPTVEQSISLNEIQYGYIVTAFRSRTHWGSFLRDAWWIVSVVAAVIPSLPGCGASRPWAMLL